MTEESIDKIFSQSMGRNLQLGSQTKPMEYMTAQSSSESGLLKKVLALNEAGWNAVGDVESIRVPANLLKKTR